jgi:hypothetical protein
MMEHTMIFTVDEYDFKEAVGRKPKNIGEFNEWAGYVEKGLFNGHIQYDILFGCAADCLGAE